MAKSITLQSAVVWECEACEGENFHRLLLKEFSGPEEKQYYADKQGLDANDLRSGEYVVIPEVVQCFFCDAVYNVDGYWSSMP